MTDSTTKCIEPKCGQEFVTTAKEREFFQKKMLPEPKRCKRCRFNRRALKGGMHHPLGGEFGANKEL